jgi:hypothetical protein
MFALSHLSGVNPFGESKEREFKKYSEYALQLLILDSLIIGDLTTELFDIVTSKWGKKVAQSLPILYSLPTVLEVRDHFHVIKGELREILWLHFGSDWSKKCLQQVTTRGSRSILTIEVLKKIKPSLLEKPSERIIKKPPQKVEKSGEPKKKSPRINDQHVRVVIESLTPEEAKFINELVSLANIYGTTVFIARVIDFYRTWGLSNPEALSFREMEKQFGIPDQALRDTAKSMSLAFHEANLEGENPCAPKTIANVKIISSMGVGIVGLRLWKGGYWTEALIRSFETWWPKYGRAFRAIYESSTIKPVSKLTLSQ